MSALAYFLGPLLSLISFVLWAAFFLFLLRGLLSWFPMDPRDRFIRIVNDITDPVLEQIRRIVPPMGTVDFSPMIAGLLCWFLNVSVIRFLQDVIKRAS
jgi:YggT family protein